MNPVRRRSGALTLASGAALALGLLGAGQARAQGGGSTAKVAAETLFEEGRRLMAEGKAAEACPKFAESQRLDPSPGTLLNLASCYEKSDRPATAWATYREGASASSAAGRQDLLATAQRHADSLFPTLPRLSVSVPTPRDGMSVALDGVSVGRAEWGVAVPVDPGDHTVEATAPRFVSWSTKITVGKEGTTTTISVPALEPAPEPSPRATAAPATTLVPPPPVSPSPQPPPEAEGRGTTQRVVGIVVGAAGIVGLGLSVGFAANAKSTYNASLADCEPGKPNLCTQDGVNQRNSALNSGNIATVALVAGGVATAAGLVLWLTAPHSHASSSQAALSLVPVVGDGLGGAALRGAW